MANTTLFPKINAALGQLDPSDDSHWADDGLPKVSVVQRLANDQSIKREDIQAANPGFERPPQGEPEAPRAQTAGTDDDFGMPSKPAVEPAQDQGRDLTDEEVHSILTQEVADADRAVKAAQEKQAEGLREERAAWDRLNQARKNMTEYFPPLTPEQNIKDHIAAANAERAARAGHRPPSQVDAAMGRSNARGWRRPVRGIVGADGNLIKDATGQVIMPRPMQARPMPRQGVRA